MGQDPASHAGTAVQPHPVPLFVDLDGTLIRTDLLMESAALVVRHDPAVLFRLPLWLLRGGRARLKRELAKRAVDQLDFGRLPPVEEVVTYLREQRQRGRHIVLATASHRLLAERVADSLGVFDGVIATEGENLKGERKLGAIRGYCAARGLGEDFEYIGDSSADEPLFAAASAWGVVGARRFPRLSSSPVVRFEAEHGRIRAVLKLIRPHQWAKNVLLFVPVIAGQRLFDVHAVMMAVLGVVVFSLLASSVYVVNDLLDIDSDRRHPRKKMRPLARGSVSIPVGVALAIGLLVASMAVALVLTPRPFIGLAVLYVMVSSAYSLRLKRKMLVDVMCLAGLYTLRILAGGAVAGIVVSPWLLAFSMFVFLSLAFVKRYTELATTLEKSRSAESGEAVGGPRKVSGRGYFEGDLDLIRSVGPSAGYVAALVLALYVSAPEVSKHYSTPAYLYGLCPLVLYWLTRVWFLAHRNHLHDDPVVFALTDRTSHLVLVLSVMVLMAAKFL